MTPPRKPPTAIIRDVTCPSGDRASAASVGTVTEDELLAAYRFPFVDGASKDCACGGDIRPMYVDWGWIAAAIRAHQETELHQAWRLREGIE